MTKITRKILLEKQTQKVKRNLLLVDNMHFKADFGKQEITKILIRDLKEAINVSFEDYVEMTKPELHTFKNRNYNKHMKKDLEK